MGLPVTSMEDNLQAPVTPTTRAEKHRRRTKTTKGLAFPRSAMGRIMRNLLDDIPTRGEKRLQPGAKRALQQAAEEMLEGRFRSSAKLVTLCGGKVLKMEHWKTVRDIERSAYDAPVA